MAKKKMARGLIVLGGILLGAVSLSGCGNKTSDGKTEVEMISYKPEAVAAFEKIEERLETVEQQPIVQHVPANDFILQNA